LDKEIKCSPYYQDRHDGREMPNAKIYEEYLVRLPLWVGLSKEQIDSIVNVILNFYG
tara:strand:- start:297 stop:467 length:171 start_codon:yes stop_codon:yes gene_type:complete